MLLVDLKKKLRFILGDSDKDKLAHRKKVYGKVNGTNKVFKTFEKRRITDFTQSSLPQPQGVLVNGSRLTHTDVAWDDPLSGEFELVNAPAVNSVVEATYYIQDFLDSELEEFLANAALWLVASNNPESVTNGLVPALLHYAAHEAYMRLSIYYQQKISNMYLTEDLPRDSDKAVVDTYLRFAEEFKKKAFELRDSFYSGKGEEKKPLFGVVVGDVKKVTPNR